MAVRSSSALGRINRMARPLELRERFACSDWLCEATIESFKSSSAALCASEICKFLKKKGWSKPALLIAGLVSSGGGLQLASLIDMSILIFEAISCAKIS